MREVLTEAPWAPTGAKKIVSETKRKTEHTHLLVSVLLKPLFWICFNIQQSCHRKCTSYSFPRLCEIPETWGRSEDTDTFADIRRRHLTSSEWQRLVCLFVFVKSLLTLTVTFNRTIATSGGVKTYRNVCANIWSSSCWVNEGHNHNYIEQS